MLATKTPKPSTRSRRQALLTGAAIAIAMTAMARAPKAQAQAFQGNPTVSVGNVTINRSPGQDNLTVNTAQAIIDWTTFDQGVGGPAIDFLPAANSAFFEASTSLADFTVLNRIVPTDQSRGIALNGTIESRVGNLIGGNVWFYSPGGIIAGASSSFDVGGLVLTSNAIDVTNGLFGDGAASTRGTIRFRGAPNSSSAVEIMSGARITARNQALGNAYVALVAPRVVQRGTIDTFGSTALVSAEQADLTISFGNLFDINILVGTTAGTAIDHSGTTGGTGSGNSVYLATIAKNSAVTMLVAGTLGYTPASTASFDNAGNVVLSAGYDVTTTGIAATPDNANAANISIGSSNFTSNVVAHSNNDLSVSPGSFGSIDFGRDATLSGDQSVSFVADGGESIQVGRNLTLVSRRGGTGNSVLLSAEFESGYGSSIDILGDLVLDASGIGADDLETGTSVGEDALGGSVLLQAIGSDVTIGGNAQLLADATPGLGVLRSGNGTGGSARIMVDGGGTLIVGDGTGQLDVSANGNSSDKNGFFNLTENGGDGLGGLAEIAVNNGALEAGAATISATGSGGSGGFNDGVVVANGSGGDGTGGSAQFTVLGAGSAALASLTVSSFGQSGGASFESTGGGATGGASTVSVNGGVLGVDGFLSLDADAFAGGGASGGEANGGAVQLVSLAGGMLTAGDIGLRAAASASFANDVGGSAFGGGISILADSGQITANSLFASADADGGSGDIEGGAAIGGSVILSGLDGGSYSAFDTFLGARGDGGSGGTGGDGSGGIVQVRARDGTLDFTNEGIGFVTIDVQGEAGTSFDLGAEPAGAGGVVQVITELGVSGEAEILFDDFEIDASGHASTGGEGLGGIGTGGEVEVTIGGGLFVGESLDVLADGGDGGNGGEGFGDLGGAAIGGTVSFQFLDGVTDIGNLGVSAEGFGGRGIFGDNEIPAGVGGDGTGGGISVIASGGQLSLGTVLLDASGQGGEGGSGLDVNAAAGGTGSGGTISFQIGDGVDFSAGDIALRAEGVGGEGGFVDYFGCGQECGYGGEDEEIIDEIGGMGGQGIGGNVSAMLGAASAVTGSIELDADGFGGDGGSVGIFFGESQDGTAVGGAGGLGTGGTASLAITGAEITLDFVQVEADGDGGQGGFAFTGGGAGDAAGGSAAFSISDATVSINSLTVRAQGEGEDGEDGYSRDGGDGGSATGGTASIVAQGETALLTIFNLELGAGAEGGRGGDGSIGFSPEVGGRGGNGGAGTGGSAELIADLGSIVLETGYGEGFAFFEAGGFGGEGGDGGNGTLTGLSGGVGGDGGAGTGGAIRIEALAGTITTNTLDLAADGFGGEGGFGGLGAEDEGDDTVDPPIPPSGPFQSVGGAVGLGSGGLVRLYVEDNNELGALGLLSLGDAELSASGLDFFGSFSGEAGQIQIVDNGADPDGSVRFSSLEAEAFGSDPGANGGILLSSTDGAIRVDNFASLDTRGRVTIDATGSGGLDVGGQLFINADNGLFITHSDRPDDVPTISAFSIDAFTSGPLIAETGTELVADHTLTLRSQGSGATAARLLAGSGISVRGLAGVTVGDAIVSGTGGEGFGGVEIWAGFNGFSEGGSSFIPADAVITGAVQADEVDVRAGRDIVVEEGASLTGEQLLQLYATRDIVGIGSLVTAGTLNVGVGEDLNMGTIDVGAELNTIDIDGDITDADRLVIAGELNVTEEFILRTGTLDVQAARITLGAATADGDMLLDSATTVAATGLVTAANLSVSGSEGIALTTTDVAGNAFFQSGGGIVVSTDLGVGGEVGALGADIDFTSLGSLTLDNVVATNGDIRATSAQDLIADDLRSGGDIRLTSTAASVFLSDVTTQPDAGEEGFQGEAGFGALAVGNPGPGDIIVDAAVDIVALDDVDARRNISMAAGQRIDVGGLVSGISIDLESADIAIGAEGGQLGRSTQTSSIRFENSASGTQTFIGGSDSGDQAAGYRLSGAEIGRVFTNGDILIVAPGSGTAASQPDVLLGTMTVNGQTGSGTQAGQLANGGRFRVQTPGRLAITGDVDFVGLANEARVELDADQQISLAAESGSLSVRGAGNALAGELILSSNMIIAGTADAIADVATATSTDAINDRLGQAEGTANDDGFFAARGMRVQAVSGFFVQNSGAAGGTTPGDRRGLTVGEGGLQIATSGPSTRIVINGRQQTAGGGFTTGAELIPQVQINTSEGASAQFDPRSTINGCLILGGAQCGQVVEPPPEPELPMVDPTPTVRDLPLGDDPVPGDPGEGSAFPTALVTFADFESFGFEPLIDEPVTGAGNDDLWLAPQDEEDEDESD